MNPTEERLTAAATMVDETDGKVSWESFEQFQLLMEQYRAGIEIVEAKLKTLDSEFRVRYSYNPIHHIEARLKEPHSIFEKMQRLGLPKSLDAMCAGLTDIAGVRVICQYICDAETIARLLLEQEDVTLLRKTNYIEHPKESGYRSLHLVISVPVNLYDRLRQIPVEVQIRTIAMDCWATLEHHLGYKSASQLPEKLRYRLRICAMAISEIDEEMQNIKEEIEKLNP